MDSIKKVINALNSLSLKLQIIVHSFVIIIALVINVIHLEDIMK